MTIRTHYQYVGLFVVSWILVCVVSLEYLGMIGVFTAVTTFCTWKEFRRFSPTVEAVSALVGAELSPCAYSFKFFKALLTFQFDDGPVSHRKCASAFSGAKSGFLFLGKVTGRSLKSFLALFACYLYPFGPVSFSVWYGFSRAMKRAESLVAGPMPRFEWSSAGLASYCWAIPGLDPMLLKTLFGAPLSSRVRT